MAMMTTVITKSKYLESGFPITVALQVFSRKAADEIILTNDILKYANRIAWNHSAKNHWLTEIHNPKSVISYDLERVSWLEEVVNRFIQKPKR